MIRLLNAALLWLGLLLLCHSEAFAGDPTEWKAGFASAKITPAERIPLAGYASRKAPFEDVHHDLYVKVMALEDHQGHQGLLITADLIGFAASLSDAIAEQISERTGLKREQILFNASHTHSGPDLSAGRAEDEQSAARIKQYVDDLQQHVVSAATRALEDLQPARLSWGRGVANFVMNRREFTPNGVRLGVQPSGLADRTVPVLRVQDGEGKLRCVLFGTACHNTTLTGDNLTVSGDYAGFAQYHIEAEHPDVQAMFLLGCGGDANPYPRGTLELAQQHGEALGKEVCRVLETELSEVRGPLRTLLEYVNLPLEPIASRAVAEEIAADPRSYRQYVGSEVLEILDRGEKLPTHYRAPLALWQFGDDLTLVAISGETVVDYVKRVEQGIGPLNLWVAGYCNDVFGYLPSAQVLREGGYETRGMIRGGAGFFSPEAEEVVVERIIEMAREAGRGEESH